MGELVMSAAEMWGPTVTITGGGVQVESDPLSFYTRSLPRELCPGCLVPVPGAGGHCTDCVPADMCPLSCTGCVKCLVIPLSEFAELVTAALPPSLPAWWLDCQCGAEYLNDCACQ